ncbi:MAG: cyclopropane-fatty-acyl-phospholipid synthase family protein [Actinomycetota bacterium]
MTPNDRVWSAVSGLIGGHIRAGTLAVQMPDGDTRVFRGDAPGPAAEISLRNFRLIRRLATVGAIGLADSYIDEDFTTPDLEALLQVAALQLEPDHRRGVPAPVEHVGRALWRRLGHAAEPRGPLRTTVAHYDLGNDFYASWLDPTMTYSSAFFERDDMTLEAAQLAKYRRMAQTADLRSGQRVLEVGSGWGGFALYAAREIGCHVTTITVSREQHLYVAKLVAEQGLADRVDARLEDYADVAGAFDRIVSIEMIESIPGTRWPDYFRRLHGLLAPGGRLGLQSIWVADHHWRDSNENPDFIRRYVFPGAQVPSLGVLRRDSSAAGFRWLHDTAFGDPYARTLHRWLEGFDAAWPQIAEMGFDQRFRRMWRYYLAYCRAGFAVGRTSVSQIALLAD